MIGTAAARPLAPLLEAKDKTKRLVEVASSFGELTSLLIRSPEHSQFKISDLEWLVMSAFVNRQFLIIRSPSPGASAPMPSAAVMWASVSDDLDTLFKHNPGQRYQLTAEQRVSGGAIWITDVVGEPLIWNRALEQLRRTVFKGHKIAMARRATDGTVSVIEHAPE